MTKFNKGYEDLQVWQKSIDLAEQVYLATRNFPKEELFGLVMQMRRSSISISSNIAEGCSRNSPKEFQHFLSIASGSAAELKTQLVISRRVELMKKELSEMLVEHVNIVERMLAGLSKGIEKPATRNLQLATCNIRNIL
jgi:four helix bundle protein